MIKLTYIGRRLSGQTVYSVFLHGKKEKSFKFIFSTGVIGGVYEGEKKGKHVSIKRRPKYITQIDDVDLVSRWEAEDMVVAERLKEKRTLAVIRRDTELRKSLAYLKKVTKGMNFIELRLLVNHIIDELS